MKKHLIFWAAALLFQLASTASDVQNAVQPYLLPLPREYTQSEKFVSGTAHIYFEDNWGISAGTADFLKREFQWALNAVFTQKRNNGDFRLVLKKCPASELPSNPEAYTLAIDAERNIILKAANRSGMFRAMWKAALHYSAAAGLKRRKRDDSPPGTYHHRCTAFSVPCRNIQHQFGKTLFR